MSMSTPTSYALLPAIRAFFVLQILSASLFMLIVIAAVVSHIRGLERRNATFYSFCAAWIIYGFSFSLLVLAGQPPWKGDPEFKLCFAQVTLIYMAPLVTISTTLALLLHLLFEILCAVVEIKLAQKWRRWRSFAPLLVLIPWTIAVIASIAFAVYSSQHRDLVALSNRRTFCKLHGSTIQLVSPIYSTIGSAIIILVEALVAALMYRHWDIVSRNGSSMFIRAVIFTVTIAVSTGIAAKYSSTATPSIGFDIGLATLPLIAAILFGSQKDLFLAFVFWKDSEKLNSTRRNSIGSVDGNTCLTSHMMNIDSESMAETSTISSVGR
ncbi:hypothetical protein BDN72DRAFT_674984 [Pluteus cervinus]|uniref:Uncharacterized protein n=1 Tax=Pluteus cervinus TaxID=181527 RepID=A0ACD3AUB5_9AGAR|nr:hypothetical protein BDN72DRAFT_674984 [Pluteus cervinus]